MAPQRLWRPGPPFSWRMTVGAFVCMVIGHHEPVRATHSWSEESRTWTPVSDEARAHFCQRCGATTSPRFDMLRFTRR